MFYWIAWSPTKGIAQDAWRRFCGAEVGPDLNPDFTKKRNLANGYLQDRAAMKAGDFTGIAGIPTQDMALWESMGPIADRSIEHLGPADVAIVTTRRLLLQACRDVEEGKAPLGSQLASIPLRAGEKLLPAAEPWKDALERELTAVF
jgi:phthalate 4,5-dioxygenase oxygenase subunit